MSWLSEHLHSGLKTRRFLSSTFIRSKPETPKDILWSKLRDKKLNGSTFHRNYPIEGFTVDFYCPEKKLVVEVRNGSKKTATQMDDEIGKAIHLMEQEITSFGFLEKQIEEDLEWVMMQIEGHLASE